MTFGLLQDKTTAVHLKSNRRTESVARFFGLHCLKEIYRFEILDL